jgi:hypothetical protein
VAVCIALFRVYGKANYSEMCVMVTYFQTSMRPHLRDWYNKHRSVSHVGNKGSNIWHDQRCERQNNECKEILGHRPLKEHVGQRMTQLNGIKEVESKLLTAFGIDRPESAGTKAEIGDVNALLRALEGVLGTTFSEFMRPRGNPFYEAPARRATRRQREIVECPAPWTLIEKEVNSEAFSNYIKNHPLGLPKWH